MRPKIDDADRTLAQNDTQRLEIVNTLQKNLIIHRKFNHPRNPEPKPGIKFRDFPAAQKRDPAPQPPQRPEDSFVRHESWQNRRQPQQ
jgi:hypothetical protein